MGDVIIENGLSQFWEVRYSIQFVVLIIELH